MIDAALMVLVPGVVAVALAIDLAALIGFLRRRIAEHAERIGP
jgi:hypothetical protein